MVQQLWLPSRAETVPSPGRTGPSSGAGWRDGESGNGEVPEMKGNDKNKSLPKTSQSGFDCTGEGSSSGTGCKGKRAGASS